MELLDNNTFLERLADLFRSTKEKGSVWLTHKRFHYDGGDAVMDAAGEDDREYPVLLRATDGEKNISTRINPSELETFHAVYGTLLKSNMANMRKRDRKREKLRAELKAQRQKKLFEEIKVDGAKRGAGRSKRQRKEKALRKQQASKERIEKAKQGKS